MIIDYCTRSEPALKARGRKRAGWGGSALPAAFRTRGFGTGRQTPQSPWARPAPLCAPAEPRAAAPLSPAPRPPLPLAPVRPQSARGVLRQCLCALGARAGSARAAGTGPRCVSVCTSVCTRICTHAQRRLQLEARGHTFRPMNSWTCLAVLNTLCNPLPVPRKISREGLKGVLRCGTEAGRPTGRRARREGASVPGCAAGRSERFSTALQGM